MTVTDALNGVMRLGMDTAPFIYFVERNPSFHALCVPVFTAIDAGQFSVFTPTLTLPETLMHPLRSGDTKRAAAYRDLLLNTSNIVTLSLSVAIAERAADLRARYNLRTPDAVQLATALDAGCDAFLTNDAALRRVTEIPVLVLGQLTL
jgi:predicted nucleic acid-binding protein